MMQQIEQLNYIINNYDIYNEVGKNALEPIHSNFIWNKVQKNDRSISNQGEK